MDNAAALLVDAAVDDGQGSRTALVTPGRSVTYAELRALTDRTARALRELGVEPEHRVAMLLADGIPFAATFLAAIKLGAVAVPLNTRLSAEDHAAILRDARARVLVAEPELLRPLEAHRPGVPLRHALRFDELPAAPDEPLRAEAMGPDAMAFWLYTSGTTGAPRAAVHGHRTILAGRHYAELLGVGAADRVFASSRLFFAYALGNALLNPLLARAQSYLLPEWPEPARVAEIARSYRPTLLFSVPTFYARVLRAGLPPDTFASVRACVSAGEPLPAEVYQEWRERFGVEIVEGLGATETVFMVLSHRPGASRPGCLGTPVPGSEARLLDADGAPVPEGAPGTLWVRTPSVAMGYWQRLDHSRRSFVGDWLRTGDVCYRNADGAYVHCGREDDSFKVAGMWVMPAEVEAIARAHPEVMEAGVVGAEAPSGLVKPHLFVVPRDPRAEPAALAADLRRRLEAMLAPHKRPQTITLVAELPRTATGKLQRFKLREDARRLARER
jgi:benzoate-CoA ligase